MLDNIYMLTDIEPEQWQCHRDSFLMDSGGKWHLSHAYDMGHAYNPDGQWTSALQMSINGTRKTTISYTEYKTIILCEL